MSGAPWKVQIAVGAAPKNDQLRTLRNFYPDAEPYGQGNYIYSDPDSGEKMLFNEPGFDVKDFAAQLPQAAEIVGGTVGMVGGAVGGPVASVLGAGAGAALGDQLYRSFVQLLVPESADTRSFGDKVIDQAQVAAWNAGPEMAGDIIAAVPRAAKSLLTSAQTRNRYLEAEAMGLDTAGLAGALSDKPIVRKLDALISQSPGGADVMRVAQERSLGGMYSDLSQVSDNVLPEVGEGALASGGRAVTEGWQQQLGALKEDMLAQTEGLVVDKLPQARELYESLAERYKRNPKAAAYLEKPLESIGAILEEAETSGVPFAQMRGTMTDITQNLKKGDPSTGYAGESAKAMRDFERALRNDSRLAAAEYSDEAAEAVRAHDTHVREYIGEAGQTGKPDKQLIDQMATKEPGQLRNWAMSGAKNSNARLDQLRSLMPEENWQEFSKSELQNWLQRPGTPGEYSMAGFATNWKKYSPAAKKTLFGENYEYLDNMAKWADEIKKSKMEENVSKTAEHTWMREMMESPITGGAAALGGIMTGSPTATAAGLGLLAAGPAKLFVQKKLANYLTNTAPGKGYRGLAMGPDMPPNELVARGVGAAGRLIPGIADVNEPE